MLLEFPIKDVKCLLRDFPLDEAPLSFRISTRALELPKVSCARLMNQRARGVRISVSKVQMSFLRPSVRLLSVCPKIVQVVSARINFRARFLEVQYRGCGSVCSSIECEALLSGTICTT